MNRAMAQLLGGFLVLVAYSVYGFVKSKVKLTGKKIISAVIAAIVSQIAYVIIMFFVFLNAPTSSDIAVFEWAHIRFIIAFVIVSALSLVLYFMVHKQKKAGIRTTQQELYSAVMIPSLIALVELVCYWKVIL